MGDDAAGRLPRLLLGRAVHALRLGLRLVQSLPRGAARALAGIVQLLLRGGEEAAAVIAMSLRASELLRLR